MFSLSQMGREPSLLELCHSEKRCMKMNHFDKPNEQSQMTNEARVEPVLFGICLARRNSTQVKLLDASHDGNVDSTNS